MKKTVYALTVLSFLFIVSAGFANTDFDLKYAKCSHSNPCTNMTPACTGGPAAQSRDLLTWRWLGAANVELTYRNQVILLSSFFGREAGRYDTVLIPPEEVIRADAIFLGHAHGDHAQDAAQVSLQTGALVYGHQTAIDYALKKGLPPANARPVVSGDVFQFHGFKVQAIHIFHSGIDDPSGPQGPSCVSSAAYWAYVYAAFGDLKTPYEIPACVPKPPPSETTEGGRIVLKGVMAYLFTFGKDFRVIFYDSASTVISDEIRAALQKIGGVDVASVAYAGGHSNTQVPYTMVPIKLFNPKLFIPNHHDSYEMPMEKLFQAIRDEMPKTTAISPLYKEPICFDVKDRTATKISPMGDIWFYKMKK